MEMLILMIFWGFSLEAQIFQDSDSWKIISFMPTNQRRNSVKPIYLARAANSLLFELPKNCLKCLTCQLPKPRNTWSLAFRQNSTNFIYNRSTFFPPPEIVFISSILNWVGATASARDCKGFNIYYLWRTAASVEQILPRDTQVDENVCATWQCS